MFIQILKLTIIALGIVIIGHLLIKIMLNQNTVNHFTGNTRYRNHRQNNVIPYNSMEHMTNNMSNNMSNTISIANQNIDYDCSNNVDFNAMKNDLKNWLESDKVDGTGTTLGRISEIPEYNGLSSSIDQIFRETEVRKSDSIDQVPPPIQAPDYSFKSGSVSSPYNNSLPKPQNVTQEPMAWNTAFETINGEQNKTMDGLSPWDNGGLNNYAMISN